MQLGEELHLANGGYSVRMAPAAGARMTRLSCELAGRTCELLVPWTATADFDEHDWPKAGAFPLAPFNNKLAGARFRWQGRDVRLPPVPGQAYALHGFLHRETWSVERATHREARLRFVHPARAQGWPWAFSMSMTVEVGTDGVDVQTDLTNTSDGPMPAAIGWHPFHALPPASVRTRGLRLRAGARENLGPDGLRCIQPSEPLEQRRHRCQLQAPGTQVFTQWDGELLLAMDDEVDLHVRASGSPHLLCHVPAHARHVCLEPISALPGALASYGGRWRDCIALSPGKTRRLSWHCSARTVRWNQPPDTRGAPSTHNTETRA